MEHGTSMRIAILTQYFPPEMGAPQARLYELAMRLQGMGHKITIITAMPNYPTGKVFDDYRRRLFAREEMNGLRIIRTWIAPSISANLVIGTDGSCSRSPPLRRRPRQR